ncbi:MAG: Nif3-like dinuclear metal center hexameric protein [Bacteroidota bacterium]|nr:Nif3-like dinuclear metal center hexameric protein [Bacteroidota bacterium]
MQIKEICNYLEQIAPPHLQEDYDNSGLLIGNANNTFTKALITLDVTEAVVQEAIDNGCNMIIAHHPLIFGGLKRITGKDYVQRCVAMAIKNDIAIYAIHTNLDNVLWGVNAKIAEKLGLQNLKILDHKDGQLLKLVTFVPHDKASKVREVLFAAGAGTIGLYDNCTYNVEGLGTFKAGEGTNPYVGEKNKLHEEPETRIETIVPIHLKNEVQKALINSHPYEEVAYDWYPILNTNPQIGSGVIGELEKEMEVVEWLEFLKAKMNLSCIRYTKSYTGKVKKVAICGGSGSFLQKTAMAAGADAYVTADFKYHEFFIAENSMLLCDIGHYESEIFTNELLLEKLREKYLTFAAQISAIDTNPINYY